MRIWTLLVLPLLVGCPGTDKDSGDPTETGTAADDLDGDGFTVEDGDCDDTDAQVNPGAAEVYYTGIDEDCDTVGTVDDDQDADGSAVAVDCDDTDAAVNPDAEEVCDNVDNDCNSVVDDGASGTTTGWTDADEDGYGNAADPVQYCGETPDGVVANDDDCDDADAAYNPGAAEECTDTVDYNCDGSVGYVDGDGDGFAACLECDDGNAAVYPGATEVCNGLDDNCDGTTDTDAVDQTTWYTDSDADGYGTDVVDSTACEQPAGTSSTTGDCNDADAAVNPGADEECTDTEDLNCDGSVGYVDGDNDGVAACDDCDDANAAAYPGGTEVCDGADNDCNGTVDDAADAAMWYADSDNDGYGDATTSMAACSQPDGYVADATDCDDTTGVSNPGASELCDDLDNDCNGDVDDSAIDAGTYFTDRDSDGYGTDDSVTTTCDPDEFSVLEGGDCDDTNSATSPAATETCDGVDNDCNGVVDDGADGSDAWYLDSDSDGYGTDDSLTYSCTPLSGYELTGGDCDDAVAAVNPGATEVCNGYDDNCDGDADGDAVDASVWYDDTDADGHGASGTAVAACDQPGGSVDNADDCDDTDPAVSPDGVEACNGYDDNCDTAIDDAGALGESNWYADSDNDSFGDELVTLLQCNAPSGYVSDSTDCDDGDSAVYPGAPDDYDLVDSDCDGHVDEDDRVFGDLIVTEVARQPRFGGTSTVSNGAWFEVYNASGDSIDMSNMYITRYGGTSSGDAFLVDPAEGLVVAPGDYVVFCKTDDYEALGTTTYPLYCDYVIGDETQAGTYEGTYHDNTFNVQRDEDVLGLYFAGGFSLGILMDDVWWTYDATDGYWPREATRSMTLDPANVDATLNDDEAYWCSTTNTTSYTWWNSGSSYEYGTPGAAGYDCP